MAARVDITVVGLGPGDPSALTVAASQALRSAPVFLRTRIHPTLDAIPEAMSWQSFDDLYRRANGFDELYEQIVARLLEAAQKEPIVYAVPGHPMFGESTVSRLLAAAYKTGIRVRVLPAVSFLDAVATVLQLDPLVAELQIVDALELAAVSEREPFAGGQLPVSALRPSVIAQLYAPSVASAAKLALLRRFPADHPVRLVYAAGTEQERVVDSRMFELDHARPDHLTSVYLPPVDPLRWGRESDALQRIVGRLRAPGGCPWDREQTHRSLTQNAIEEAYEVVDAIERDDSADLQEELGDLMLQVFLHAQLAEEAGTFVLEDVFGAITSKLVRRHPHVFGDLSADSADAVVKRWDEIKRAERADKGGDQAAAPFGNLPVALPALARAQTILRRAGRASMQAEHDPLAEIHTFAERLMSVVGALSAQNLILLLAAATLLAENAHLDAEGSLRMWTRDIERLFEAPAACDTIEGAANYQVSTPRNIGPRPD